MSGPIRVKIGPCIARLQGYLASANHDLAKRPTEEGFLADLVADRRNLTRSIDFLEDCNQSWERLLHNLDGEAFAAEESRYDSAIFEERHFMEWADQARGLVNIIDGHIDPSETHSDVGENLPPNPQPPPAILPRGEVNLPPLPLPKFSGNPKEWNIFWKLFERSVDRIRMDDFKKHMYLLGCLPEGSTARRTIELYPPSDENYRRVVEILKKKFADPKIMVESLQAELLHLAKPGESPNSLREFSEAIERICLQLVDYGESEKNSFMASTIKAKLPFNILTHVVEREKAAGREFNCVDLRKALQSIVEVKEEVLRCTRVFQGKDQQKPQQPSNQHGPTWKSRPFGQPTNRPRYGHDFRGKPPPKEYRSFSATNYPAQGKGQRIMKCSLCEQMGHLPSHCSRYPNPEARRRRLVEQNRCFNCLLQGHNSERCESFKRCLKCNKKHHTLVCLITANPSQHGQQSTPHSSKPIQKGNGGGGNKSNKFKQKPRGKEQTQSYLLTVAEMDPNHDVPIQPTVPIPAGNEETNPVNASSGDQSAAKMTAVAINGKKPHAFLMTRRVTVNSNRDRRICFTVPALFDPGSQTSYITDSLLKRLRPPKVTTEEMEVHGFGGRLQEPMRFKSPIFSVRCLRKDGRCEELLLNRTEQIATPFGMVEWTSDEPTAEDEEVRDAMMFTREEPEILIGARQFWKFFRGKREVSPGLFVIQTTLGPLVNGETDIGPNKPNPALSMMTIHASNWEQMPPKSEVEHFFDLESLGIKDDPGEKDDETAMMLFNKSVRREPDGRYSVKWPWKETNPDLPSNYNMALTRLTSVVKRLQDTPDILKQYDATIRDQLENDIIEPAERKPGQLEHYLPHHGVLQKKLRIVYDASAHAKGAPSFNTCLYRGPVLLPDLAGMLLRFRCPALPVMADIQAAFLNIALEPEDREVAKFLWLKDINQPLTMKNMAIFRFRRVAFGVISSPFLLAATLQHHLKNYGSPLARELESSLYVDNALFECETPEEAIHKCSQAKAIFRDARFNLREFITCSKEVMDALPEEDRLDKEKPKVLGLIWDTGEDEIVFNLPTTDVAKPITRRLVLSHLASLFDPLGLLSPCILPVKLYFQELWKEGHSWDDVLPEEDSLRWNLLQEVWKNQTIHIPRRAMLAHATHLQLHTFVDASSSTFATAVYLRCEARDRVQAWLIYSKNRLKPKGASKTLTVPRLELLAILIGIRSLRFTSEHLRRNIAELHLWSDSQIALSWVKSHDIQPVFIERRLKEIRKCQACTFHFIRTSENPADIATRGTTPDELRLHPLWWHGPSWLVKPRENWPDESTFKVEEIPESTQEETSGIEVALLANTTEQAEEMIINPSHFSSWTHLVRVTLFILRYLGFVFRRYGIMPTHLEHRRKEIAKISLEGPFTAEDVILAEKLLIRLEQMRDGEKFHQHQTVIDDDGILRLKTRLEKCDQPFSFSHPTILGNHSALVELLILHFHRKRHHLGVETTLTEFLREYWTPFARSAVKRALKKCLHCRRMKSYPFALPMMPPLPSERVRRQAPFQSIGIDFLGPTLTYLWGEKVKVWIVIVTCLATRAVYLEAMLTTSAEALLNVLRRFISRRGKPDLIWSDNATTFKLADKTLEVLTSTTGDPRIQEYLAHNRIRWRFIPQISPWAGGFYERLVKLCKDCFRRTLGRRILTIDDLNTFVAEVESTLNNRPITAVSDAEDGPMPLRPINLLHPEIQIIWETTTEEIENDYLQESSHHQLAARVQALREANDSFWEKWQREYLLLLRERAGWNHKGPRLQDHNQPKVGMVVLVGEDMVPRNQWAVGRIVQLHGHPDAIRSVTVEVPVRGSGRRRPADMPRKSLLTRPINRIFPLEAGPEITEIRNSTDKGINVTRRVLDQHIEQEDPEEDLGEPLHEAESTGGSHHRMMTRQKARTFKTLAMNSLICLMAICIPTLCIGIDRNRRYPIEHCHDCSMECTDGGVEISVPPEIQMFEICCGQSCTTQRDIIGFHYFLPKDVRRQPYNCEGKFWAEIHRVSTANISCPAIEECRLLDCTICIDQLRYPDCQPFTATMVAGGATILLMALFIFIYMSAKAAMICFWMTSAIFLPFRGGRTRRRQIRDGDEGEPMIEFPLRRTRAHSRTRATRTWTSRQLGRSIILALFYLATASCDVEPVAITARTENCIRTDFDLTCTMDTTVTLTLLPAGQTTTLLIRTEDGRQLGSIQITLRALTLDCQDYTRAWLRSYYIATVSSKRCPSAGSCTDEFCTKVRPNTTVHELREAAMYPGHNFCVDSPAFWGNQCLFGGPRHGGCLFYRWFARPRTTTVYELIGCNTWEFGVYAFFQTDDVNGKTASVETVLRPGLTMKMNNVSYSLIGVSHPPAPLLNANFLFGGGRMAIVRDDLPEILHCQDEAAARAFNCSLALSSCTDCFPDHEDGTVACECRSLNLEKIMDDPQFLLPLNFYHHNIRNMGRKPFALASYTPVQVHLSLNGLRVALEHQDSLCTVTPRNLSGCFRCASGARFDFDCQTSRGNTVAEIKCNDGTTFSTKCSQNKTEFIKFLPFDTSEIKIECQTICKAGKTHFEVSGLLHYVSHQQQVNSEIRVPEKTDEPNGSDWFNFNFSLKSILWDLIDDKLNIVLVLGMIIVTLLLVKCLTTCRKLIICLLIQRAMSESSVEVNFLLAASPPGGGSFGEEASGERAVGPSGTSLLGEEQYPLGKNSRHPSSGSTTTNNGPISVQSTMSETITIIDGPLGNWHNTNEPDNNNGSSHAHEWMSYKRALQSPYQHSFIQPWTQIPLIGSIPPTPLPPSPFPNDPKPEQFQPCLLTPLVGDMEPPAATPPPCDRDQLLYTMRRSHHWGAPAGHWSPVRDELPTGDVTASANPNLGEMLQKALHSVPLPSASAAAQLVSSDAEPEGGLTFETLRAAVAPSAPTGEPESEGGLTFETLRPSNSTVALRSALAGGNIDLDDWLWWVFGGKWSRTAKGRREAELRVREELDNGAHITEKYSNPERWVSFGGFTDFGAGRMRDHNGKTIADIYEEQGIVVNHLLPCVRETSGVRAWPELYFPTDCLTLHFIRDDKPTIFFRAARSRSSSSSSSPEAPGSSNPAPSRKRRRMEGETNTSGAGDIAREPSNKGAEGPKTHTASNLPSAPDHQPSDSDVVEEIIIEFEPPEDHREASGENPVENSTKPRESLDRPGEDLEVHPGFVLALPPPVPELCGMNNGQLQLDEWARTIFGDEWYMNPTDKRCAEMLLREELARGAMIMTNHLKVNKALMFDGFTRQGPNLLEIRPGETVKDYFWARLIKVNPLLPCAREYGGYSHRLRYIHEDYFPLETLTFYFRKTNGGQGKSEHSASASEIPDRAFVELPTLFQQLHINKDEPSVTERKREDRSEAVPPRVNPREPCEPNWKNPEVGRQINRMSRHLSKAVKKAEENRKRRLAAEEKSRNRSRTPGRQIPRQESTHRPHNQPRGLRVNGTFSVLLPILIVLLLPEVANGNPHMGKRRGNKPWETIVQDHTFTSFNPILHSLITPPFQLIRGAESLVKPIYPLFPQIKGKRERGDGVWKMKHQRRRFVDSSDDTSQSRSPPRRRLPSSSPSPSPPPKKTKKAKNNPTATVKPIQRRNRSRTPSSLGLGENPAGFGGRPIRLEEWVTVGDSSASGDDNRTPLHRSSSYDSGDPRHYIDWEAKEDTGGSRKNPRPPTCGACGETGHRQGARRCMLYEKKGKKKDASNRVHDEPETVDSRPQQRQHAEVIIDSQAVDQQVREAGMVMDAHSRSNRPPVKPPSTDGETKCDRKVAKFTKWFRANHPRGGSLGMAPVRKQRPTSPPTQHSPVGEILHGMGPVNEETGPIRHHLGPARVAQGDQPGTSSSAAAVSSGGDTNAQPDSTAPKTIVVDTSHRTPAPDTIEAFLLEHQKSIQQFLDSQYAIWMEAVKHFQEVRVTTPAHTVVVQHPEHAPSPDTRPRPLRDVRTGPTTERRRVPAYVARRRRDWFERRHMDKERREMPRDRDYSRGRDRSRER